MEKGICKLCLKEKYLLNESHIIPEFLYKEIKKTTGLKKIVILDKKNPDKKHYPKRAPKGEYEKGILCQNCDNNIIGGYEDYAAKVFNAEENEDNGGIIISHNNGSISRDIAPHFFVSNIDYKKFKLFCLSILWRASISKRNIFENIDLGPKHNEAIRKLILSGEPDDFDVYPIRLSSVIEAKQIDPNFILSPYFHRNSRGIKMVTFFISGFVLSFFLYSKNHKISNDITEFSIRKNNTLIIPLIPERLASDMIRQLFNKLLKT